MNLNQKFNNKLYTGVKKQKISSFISANHKAEEQFSVILPLFLASLNTIIFDDRRQSCSIQWSIIFSCMNQTFLCRILWLIIFEEQTCVILKNWSFIQISHYRTENQWFWSIPTEFWNLTSWPRLGLIA